MSRFLAFGTFLTLLVAPAVCLAADKPARTDGPAVMVRLQSILQLIDNTEYIADIVGQKDTIGPAIGFLKALISDKSVEGVDTGKPFVLYGSIADKIEESEGVVMVPIADKDEFLKLLKTRAKLDVEEKDGLYSTTLPNAPGKVYFRFANKYVYLTMLNKANVDEKKLPAPAEVVGKGEAVLSLGFRLDRVPEQMKQFALGGIETALAAAKDHPLPNETENVKALRNRAIDSLSEAAKMILFEGKELTVKIDIQPKKDELALEFELSGKDGSDLAKNFADLKSKKSVAFGSLVSNKAAVLVAANLSYPASVKKVLGPAIDDIVKLGLQMAPEDVPAMVGPLVESLLPTVKAGDFDNGFVLLGPDANGKYTTVTGGKLVGGKSVEKSVKELVKKLPEAIQTALIEIDADSVGSIKLHTLKVKDQLPDNVKSIFGESDLWIAFRDDAFLLGFGPDAKKALKDALDQSPGRGPLIKAEFSMTRLMPAIDAQNENPGKKIALDVFGKNPVGSDTMSFTVEGGDSLRTRITVKGKVLKYFALVGKAKEAKKKGD